MKITKLESENVKKLKAIEITPDGNVVVVGGKNAQGKSSTLDSIAYAIGGKGLIPGKPVRDGQKKAKIVVNLDNGLIVTRTITAAGGGTLTVKNADGARYDSPQKILDALTGELTFDPLEWSKMEQKRQLEVIKALVGLDFTDEDKQRLDVYSARTARKRTLKDMKAQYANMSAPTDELEKVDIAELSVELVQAGEHNREVAAKRDKYSEVELEFLSLHHEIEELTEKLAAKRTYHAELESKLARMERVVAGLEEIDPLPLQEKLKTAEATNLLYAREQERLVLEDDILSASDQVKRFTTEIETIDKNKSELLEAAEFPITGLAFDSDGVTYKGNPFDQCSTAERLRISVAMGFAMNPELKVLLIRDGSHLDEDNLALVTEMAAKHDGQVWIERVGKGKECSVIIEGGEIENVSKQEESEQW